MSEQTVAIIWQVHVQKWVFFQARIYIYILFGKRETDRQTDRDRDRERQIDRGRESK